MVASPPKAQPREREKVIEHLIVTAEDGVDQLRLLDCGRFIERHKLKFIYIGGSKKRSVTCRPLSPGSRRCL
jgi:hypothetical protein